MHPSLVPINDDSFLLPTKFCDHQTAIIGRAAKNITANSKSQGEMAKKVFYWVRDSIKYELGLMALTASETLIRGSGSCSNKANLMVAMLRSLGIPSGFHLMEVKTREYFGILCTERFGSFLSHKSLHVFCAVKIENRWLKVDPTDDILLSNGTQHLCPQSVAVDFDGVSDARLGIQPEHVISESEYGVPSVDDILSKKRRTHPEILAVFNYYLDFLRGHCIWHSSPQSIESDFFSWLHKINPEIFDKFLALESQLNNDIVPEAQAAGGK